MNQAIEMHCDLELCPALALAPLLAACDVNRFTADLGTAAPADPEITAVEVNLRGLDLRKSDGTVETLEFRAGELVDLLELGAGDPLRLFTDEELPVGRYTGIRLLFDDDEDLNAVTTLDREFPLLLAPGAYVAVDFSVQEDDSSREALTLVLDLRQSLTFDQNDNEYLLTPQLRAVRTVEVAQVEGNVAVACPTGTSLDRRGRCRVPVRRS